MIKRMKELLLDNPQSIQNILERYDFHNVVMNSRELRFGRSEESKKNAISIRLQNNEYLTVMDYSKAVALDLFSYISQEKCVELRDVFQAVKQELGITDYYQLESNVKKTIFGGFFNKIGRNRRQDNPPIDEEVLKDFAAIPNQRFLRDGISLKTQKKFGIGYDIESQRITIPLRDQFGQLVGCKARANWDVSDDEPKYLFLYRCAMSQILYGYYENYQYMHGGDVIICEAEKSPLQADSMGYHNVVGIGGNTISAAQAKMIVSLLPKRIILALDEGLDEKVIAKNLEILKTFSKMFDIEIGWWDSSLDIDIPEKASATDLGKKKFEEILSEQIIWEGEI